MAATPSVKIVKTGLYKGGTREFSNRYHFNGGTPADDSHWHTLFDAIVAAEKAIYTTEVTIVSAVGYAAGSDVPVSSKSYTQAGTSAASGNNAPLNCAGLVRYSTTARTTKNHPVYLFNYFHGAILATSGLNAQEKLSTSYASSLDTYASAWISGFSDGTHTLVRAGPNGATATGHQTEEYITHRDFPYLSSV